MRLIPIFWSLLLFYGCRSPEEQSSMPPENLEVNVYQLDKDKGLYSIIATAELANYYSFEFSNGSTSELIRDNDGEVSYQFPISGNYNILVKAHASFDLFIAETINLSVARDDSSGSIPYTGYTSPLSRPGYNLVWHDEFDGNSLSSNWVHEIGTGNWGWGNNELQYYKTENTEVRDGLLIITAKQEYFNGSSYTSSRIKTQSRQSFQYGRVDIRAALPKGQGLWPALWMLGDSYQTVGWPACGEIDIMEMVGGSGIGRGDNHIFGTAHWQDSNGNRAQYGNSNKLSNGIYADEFHVFSIVWDSNKITWYRDDIKYNELDITPASLSEFRASFFFIINVAVGGNWPGSPDSSTRFPQQMAVDYIRVFQK